MKGNETTTNHNRSRGAEKNSTMRRLIFNLIVVAVALTLTGCVKYKKPTTTPVAERIALDKHPAHIVSAFFGLDNALPRGGTDARYVLSTG